MVGLAMRDDVAVGCDAVSGEQVLQTVDQSQLTRLVHQVQPIEIDRPWYVPGACDVDVPQLALPPQAMVDSEVACIPLQRGDELVLHDA